MHPMSSEKKSKSKDELSEDFTEVNSNIIFHLYPEQCPTFAVTIFSDRAEVTRNIKGKVDKMGIHEIHVHGLSNMIETDTFRISGGIGSIVLMEVVTEQSVVDISEEEKSENEKKRDILLKEIEEIEGKIKILNIKKNRIDDDIRIYEKLQNIPCVTQVVVENEVRDQGVLSVPEAMKRLESFLVPIKELNHEVMLLEKQKKGVTEIKI